LYVVLMAPMPESSLAVRYPDRTSVLLIVSKLMMADDTSESVTR